MLPGSSLPAVIPRGAATTCARPASAATHKREVYVRPPILAIERSRVGHRGGADPSVGVRYCNKFVSQPFATLCGEHGAETMNRTVRRVTVSN